MHSLAPMRRHHLGLRIELDAESPLVEGGDCLAELGPPTVGGVRVRARVGHRPLRSSDDRRVGRRVGVADAEADHIDAGCAFAGDLALELGEQVRRNSFQATTRSH